MFKFLKKSVVYNSCIIGATLLSGCTTTQDGTIAFEPGKLKFWENFGNDSSDSGAEKAAVKSETTDGSQKDLAKVKAELKAEILKQLKEDLNKDTAGGNSADIKQEQSENKNAFSNLTQAELDMVNKTGDKFAEEFIKAIKKSDYKLFIKNMAPGLKDRISKKQFFSFVRDLKKSQGECTRLYRVTVLKAGLFVTPVYKLEFKNEKNKISKVNETLFRLNISKLNNKYLIWSFKFN